MSINHALSSKALLHTICFSPEAMQVRVRQHITKTQRGENQENCMFFLYIKKYLSTSSESNALQPLGAVKFQCLISPPKSFIICQVYEMNVAIADNY